MKSFKILDDDGDDKINAKEIKTHINKNIFMSSDGNIKIKYAFLDSKNVGGTLTYFINITYDKWPSYIMIWDRNINTSDVVNSASSITSSIPKSNTKITSSTDKENTIKNEIKLLDEEYPNINISVGQLTIQNVNNIILYYNDLPNTTYKLNNTTDKQIFSNAKLINDDEHNPISKLEFDANFTPELINKNKSKQLYLEIRGVNGYLNVTGNQSAKQKTYKLHNIKIPVYNKENTFEEFDPDIFNV